MKGVEVRRKPNGNIRVMVDFRGEKISRTFRRHKLSPRQVHGAVGSMIRGKDEEVRNFRNGVAGEILRVAKA